MLRKLRLKLNSRRGMTIFETLVAVTIMACVFTVTVGAIVAASACYKSVSVKTEAQVFLTENITSVMNVCRYTDENREFVFENLESVSSTEEGGSVDNPHNPYRYERDGQKVQFTSANLGYEGYFENFPINSEDKDSPTVIRFTSSTEEDAGKIMAINSNDNIPLSAKIVFYEGSNQNKMIFKVTVLDGDIVVAWALVTAYPVDKELQ